MGRSAALARIRSAFDRVLRRAAAADTSTATNEAAIPAYRILVPEETTARAADYLAAIRTGRSKPGGLLADRLRDTDAGALTAFDLLGLLFDTRQPQIFAETAVAGDGADWNLVELGLLGDVAVAVPVTLFDDGNHHAPTPHVPDFRGTLVFTAGALLRNDRGHTPADWDEVTLADGTLCTEGYFTLYRRRLLPVLRYINDDARLTRRAFVTIPGLGCGQFAGPFRGQLGAHLHAVLRRLLQDEGASLPNLRAVYFDPYGECENARDEIHGISLMLRPNRLPGNQAKSQLCRPTAYAEADDDFSACTLYSLVAWDHVSWPGNDYFVGSRATDDGVKSAATDAMSALTGVDGHYDPALGKYLPPAGFRIWADVVQPGIEADRLRLWNRQALYAWRQEGR